jgi:hypothetical protein
LQKIASSGNKDISVPHALQSGREPAKGLSWSDYNENPVYLPDSMEVKKDGYHVSDICCNNIWRIGGSSAHVP